MLKVAIGPESRAPSWHWVGFDLARELSKYCDVSVYLDQIPPCDVVLAIKKCPRDGEFHPERKVIYFPIDQYMSPDAIIQDADRLRKCSAIGSHSARLLPYFRPFCNNVFLIDHHAKFSLWPPAKFREDGFILWIGAFQYVPYLLKWLEKHSLDKDLVLLTNPASRAAARFAHELSGRIDVRLNVSDRFINGFPMERWCERRQLELMQEAKAGLDIKGGPWLSGVDWWHQLTKPPTKGQQFISSGIPFAINSDSSCTQYFQSRNFAVASPLDQDRWLSYEYWQETRRQAENLRGPLSLERIGHEVFVHVQAAAKRDVSQP